VRLEGELRLDLLKLRFNRLWTCFNGLAYLLAGVAEGLVTKQHVLRMVALSPIERARDLATKLPETREPLTAMLAYYGEFLELANREKSDIVAYLEDRDANKRARALGERFGDGMAKVIDITSERAGAQRFLLL